MKARRIFWLFVTLSVLLVGFIWGNSVLSREASSQSSGAISAFLKSILDPEGRMSADSFHAMIRKVAHFVEFMLLGLCCSGAFMCFGQRAGKRYISLPLLLLLAVAVMDELIQHFFDRGSMVTDVVLDFAGAATGLGLVLLFCWIRKSKQQ